MIRNGITDESDLIRNDISDGFNLTRNGITQLKRDDEEEGER
jgi:hypothetical protein